MGNFSESEAIRRSIEKIATDTIKEQEKSCFRLYKAKLVSAPSGNTCGVQLVGDNNTLNLPYSSAIKGLSVGTMVWVSTLYNSFSNAIVFAPYTFDFNDKHFFYQELQQTLPTASDSWRIDLPRGRSILLIVIDAVAAYVEDQYTLISTHVSHWAQGNHSQLNGYSYSQAGHINYSFYRGVAISGGSDEYYMTITFTQNEEYTTNNINVKVKIYSLI